jgi:hypothetical protein
LNEARLFLREFIKERDFKSATSFLVNEPGLSEQILQLTEQKAEYPFAEHASWLWIHLAKEKPQFAQPFYARLLDILFETKNESVLRNILNALSQLELEEYRESEFVDLLFGFLLNKTHKVALHVYSIYFLLRFVRKYPEFKGELQQCVDILMENPTPALTVAARNMKKELSAI